MQGYTPQPLEYRTGGPSQAENLYAKAMLREAFADMEIVHLSEHDGITRAGAEHSGLSALADSVANQTGGINTTA